jgi:hypothetical protein
MKLKVKTYKLLLMHFIKYYYKVRLSLSINILVAGKSCQAADMASFL